MSQSIAHCAHQKRHLKRFDVGRRRQRDTPLGTGLKHARSCDREYSEQSWWWRRWRQQQHHHRYQWVRNQKRTKKKERKGKKDGVALGHRTHLTSSASFSRWLTKTKSTITIARILSVAFDRCVPNGHANWTYCGALKKSKSIQFIFSHIYSCGLCSSAELAIECWTIYFRLKSTSSILSAASNFFGLFSSLACLLSFASNLSCSSL